MEKLVCWRGFDAICVCPSIDYGQQLMKMDTEVTLLYKMNEWMNEWLIDWLTDWLIDWLVDWLIN